MSSQQQNNSRDEMTPEHAIDLPEIRGVPFMKDYLKAVASVVGAHKIVSAYRKNGKIRIYLKHLSCVEEVISTGVNILGRQTDVEYSVKSATKVLLFNVESEVLNSTIETLLSRYGRRFSKIDNLRLGLNDPEFSHIASDVRQVHMRLHPGAVIPNSLEVCQNGKIYKINVKMERADEEQLVIDEHEVVSRPAPAIVTVDETANSVQGSRPAPPTVTSYERANSVRGSRPAPATVTSYETANSVRGSTLASPRHVEYTIESSTGMLSSMSSDQLQNTSQGLQPSPDFAKRRGRPRGCRAVERNTVNWRSSYRQQILPANPNVLKSKRNNATRRAINRQPGNHALGKGQFESEALSENMPSLNFTDVKDDFDSMGNDAEDSHYIPLNFGNVDSYNAFSVPGNSARTSSIFQSNTLEIKPSIDNENYQASLVERESNNPTPYPLSLENLENFLEIVKYDLSPLKHALRMLENNQTPGAIDELCEQIIDYAKNPANRMSNIHCQFLVNSLSGGFREVP